MNKSIVLKPIKASARLFRMLEKRGLIIPFMPTKNVMRAGKGEYTLVDTLYSTAPRYGTHKLICVAKNETRIRLTAHPDNEDFIIIDMDRNKFKPLYLVIALHTEKVLEKKVRAGTLSAKDVLAVELAYNAPTSAFTLLKGVPHCEVTLPGRGRPPVFFVTEPSDFAMSYVETPGYSFTLRKR